MPRLERDGDVFVLHLDADDENRFTYDWLAAVHAALDEVEARTEPCVLVTAGSGRFWSNGLDLDWLLNNPDQAGDYLDRVHALLARTLAAATVTVAALNGHTFAAGAMWALAHDFRVMRADRGFFCLPEVDLGLPFQQGMSDLIKARLTPQVAHEAMTTARRYGGTQALAAGIVDAVAAEDEVLDSAVGLARSLTAKSTPVRATVKEMLYATALTSLRTPVT